MLMTYARRRTPITLIAIGIHAGAWSYAESVKDADTPRAHSHAVVDEILEDNALSPVVSVADVIDGDVSGIPGTNKPVPIVNKTRLSPLVDFDSLFEASWSDLLTDTKVTRSRVIVNAARRDEASLPIVPVVEWYAPCVFGVSDTEIRTVRETVGWTSSCFVGDNLAIPVAIESSFYGDNATKKIPGMLDIAVATTHSRKNGRSVGLDKRPSDISRARLHQCTSVHDSRASENGNSWLNRRS